MHSVTRIPSSEEVFVVGIEWSWHVYCCTHVVQHMLGYCTISCVLFPQQIDRTSFDEGWSDATTASDTDGRC